MSVFDEKVFPFGFCDFDIATAVVKEYTDLFPDDGYIPEIEKCRDGSGFSVIVNVPMSKYENFEFAFSVVAGG
ncbi:MAG: hypothetical protein ACD_25C00085G0002 [uncultured bacterium]|uniref:Uncharacterized protein n=3 Tax=Katanobacteria TaxID=422282 RepID=A0A1F4W2F9_UNCKA|nr:MAG: hypothetical protein ACD_25C00085G0002 [uncultured bacterium]KKS03373.1 MAG: hypothetical protein UU55_C0003G0087 [candidate division WWE3 bacterium GW2011_GWC2_41_23]KKS10547.1 MAG: hypothetical protein UU64_C0003G0056 [candidate division WWE3 bacterium GW2011_GWF2_41_45]KKS20258.1 MAG: hypothetical protein UU79_C0002G0024 [candidate division WWE3 bacterium GW2011_GWE1_41_72]KKS28222.1 MAG: hypothetical protein UU90_C0033G0007 [candidate division WWE3 bacterium GW2011_GWD2_42_11]KKS28